jgi:uncharacterized protein YneF (UPF0154 family)
MVYPVALVMGVIFGSYLKRNRAEIYSGIAGDEVRNILMGVGTDNE